MIIEEDFRVRSDGVQLVRRFSNMGLKLERDGALYDEAIDPANEHREYTETDVPVEVEDG